MSLETNVKEVKATKKPSAAEKFYQSMKKSLIPNDSKYYNKEVIFYE